MRILSIMTLRDNQNWDIEELVQKYADTVYKIAYVQLKNKADAEDIFQEVFVKLVKNYKRLESEEHVKAWLIRVTINCCKSYFRSSWYQKVTSFDERRETVVEMAEESDLVEAVRALPEQYRIVIHLFYYEGYSIEEIAGMLRKKANTIKSHLFRARGMLKNKLERGEDDGK